MAQPAVMNTYGRLPVTFTRGDGVWLQDEGGKRYLDAIGGIGVNILGHAHPAVVRAIQQQAEQLIHTSNLYNIEKQEALARQLCDIAGMDSAFFNNSGAEANETAIKLARLYGHKRDIERPNIVVMEHAFHGRTLATLTASGSRKIQAGFEPLLAGFTRAPFGDVEALRTIARNNSSICAVLLEPIQGEGGIKLPPADYLAQLRRLCDDNNWLLMLDEVQTGNGRTGKYFAYQHTDVLPDVVVTAKGLANGVPIGACLARGEAATLFQPGNHGSTFGGNPLACAAALAVIKTVVDDKLCDNAAAIGEYLLEGLRQRLGKLPQVKDIRGRGLMIGIELKEPCAELVEQALADGLLINVTSERVVRLLPPLIYSRENADRLLDTLCPLIEQRGHRPNAA